MSLNNVNLTGRLTRDPEVRYFDNGTCLARFSLAVDRRFKKEGGRQADFPNIVVWGKAAEFVEKYFTKGMKMEVSGRLETGSYEREDGTKVYTTDVVAENVSFAESRAASQGHQAMTGGAPDPSQADNGFMEVPADFDGDELPFA